MSDSVPDQSDSGQGSPDVYIGREMSKAYMAICRRLLGGMGYLFAPSATDRIAEWLTQEEKR